MATRNLERELDDGAAGEHGIAVDAVCTGCKRVRSKRAYVDADDVRDGGTSFKHVCHRCHRVTWWNAIRVLEGGSDE